MFLNLVVSAWALPPATAAWSPLQAAPVRIDCTEHQGQPYCRSTGVIGAPLADAVAVFEQLDRHVDKMGSIVSVRRLEPDILHVVMDYPWPIQDRDYVARFAHNVEPDGTHVFAWTPTTHPGAPAGAHVRLDRLDGEWRFAADPAGTRVTYLWQADPGGGLPDVGAVRKKAGQYAIDDMAAATGTKRLSP
jgi:hypothetical protein